LTKMVFLNEFGASLVPFHVPEDSAAGSLKLTLSGMVGGKKQSFLGGVEVSQEGLPWTKLALDFKETNVALGTVIQGKVSAKYRWGAPLVARKVLLTMPGGLTRDLLTDEKGVALFEYPTKDLYFGKIDFRVSVPSTDALSVLGSVKISNRIHKVSAHLAQSLVISGEELEISLKAKTYDDQTVARKLRVGLMTTSSSMATRK